VERDLTQLSTAVSVTKTCERKTMRILPSLLSVSLAFGSSVWALEPVHIGILLPLSGHGATGGGSVLRGIKVAHHMRPQVLGRSITLKVADTRSDPATAANAAFTLVEREKVAAMIGESSSGHTRGGPFPTERRGIPVVTTVAANAADTGEKQWVFPIGSIDGDHARLAVTLACSRLHARTAALVWDMSQESSVGLADGFRNGFTQAGGRISAETRLKAGDRDFTAEISRIKAAKPDVIYAPISATECGLLARQARLMGLKCIIIAGNQVHDPELIALGGESVEKLLFTTHFHHGLIHTEKGIRFQAACEYHSGKVPLCGEVIGAEAYFMLMDAIERAGSVLPARIREAIACTENFEGITGRISIDRDGKAHRPVFVNKVANGQFVPFAQEGSLCGAESTFLTERAP
jgi:branched-chain amino acid transport system substrate-binding protein